MDLRPVVEEIDAALRAAADPLRAVKEREYLRSELAHHGAPVPAVRRIARDVVRSRPDMTHDDLWGLVGALWREPVHERRLCAVVLLGLRSDLLSAGDVERLGALLRACRTWALVDPLATGAVSDLVARDPDAADLLDGWAADDDQWVRRGALLALVPGLRRGAGDWDRFARYADQALDDHRFFVAKAIGWGLRDAAKVRPDRVVSWLRPRLHRLDPVARREAVKPLDDERRAALADPG